MIIDLSNFVYNNGYEIPVNCEFDVPPEMLNGTDIRKISKVKIEGFIYNNEGEYLLDVTISGTMTLPCARTLKDVLYPFNIKIDESINENDEKRVEIIQNRVDIFPIIWQYILVDVPLRVLAPDIKDEVVKGEGWRLITEEDEKEEIDPRLKKLSDFIKE